MNERTSEDGADGGRGRLADGPDDIPPKGWWDVAKRLKDEVVADHVTLSAAGVAFFGFTALVPLLAAAVSIYGFVADPSDVASLVERIEGATPSEVAAVIGQQLETVTSSSSGALGLAAIGGLLVALWSASSGISHLVEAINIAYDEDPDTRPFWHKRLLAIGLTLGAIAILGVAAMLVSLTAGAGLFIQLGTWVLIALLMAFGLAVLFRYGPDRADPRWEWVSLGAGFAVVAWVVVSLGFRFYVGRFGSYNETYGSLGAIVVTLLWLYLTAAIVIIAAEINAESEHQTARDTTTGPTEPRGQRGALKADEVATAARARTSNER